MHDPNRVIAWDLVRLEVEAGDLTRMAICRKYRISRGELARRIGSNRWDVPERDDLNDRSLLLDGLLWALERQIDRLGECELNDPMKEAAALQRLATTLDDLIRLGDRHAGKPRTARESKEMQELRQKIARRLDELNLN